jgi:hypothetical protein
MIYYLAFLGYWIRICTERILEFVDDVCLPLVAAALVLFVAVAAVLEVSAPSGPSLNCGKGGSMMQASYEGVGYLVPSCGSATGAPAP